MPKYVSRKTSKQVTLRIVMILLAILSANHTYAAPSQLSDYFKEVWTTRDGLPHNTINAIEQSEDGYLWIGTWEGAARFNGRSFTVFGRGEPSGMPDVGIRTIYKNRQQDLIFAGARGGLSERRSDDWHSWQPYQVLINAVTEDAQGNLWLATEGQGVFRQTPQGERTQFTLQQGLPSNVVSSILTTGDGTVWIGTGLGLIRLNSEDNIIKPIATANLPEVPILALTEYKNGLLIGTERGLYQYQDGEVSIFSPQLMNLPVSVVVAFENQVWVGTTDRGLFRYSDRGLEHLNMAGGLPNNRILSVFRDRENSIWVGTNGGLFRLRDAPFVTLTSEQGLAGDYIRSVLSHSDGSIWVGSSQGVSRITKAGIESIDIASFSDGQSVLSLVEAPDGSVWIGTYADGVLQWKDNAIVQQFSRRTGLLANEVRAIAVAPDGGLWIGTGHGLNYVDSSGVSSFSTEQGLPTPFVMGLYLHDDGRLFIATGGGVAVRHPDGEITTLAISKLDDAEYAFGFAPDPEAGRLWMSTDRGLLAYDVETDKLTMLGRQAGLPFDKVFQAVIDQDKHLWLSSNRGILHFRHGQIEEFLAGQRQTVDFELFGESDGMQSAQANGGSMQAATLAKDGAVWFATSKGASRVNPEELTRFSANTPPVVLEGFTVNGSARPLHTEADIPAGADRIEIQFAGLGFVMPKRIHYRTKLLGFDSDWVERGSNTIAEYTNLPPGNYKFQVSAAYPGGAWGQQNASYRFTITPYFWQQTGFWFAVFLTIIAIVVVVHRWRLKSLHQRAAELSTQVADQTFVLKKQADDLRKVDEERTALLLEIKRQAADFEQQARSDKLTGLANRRAFDEALHRECAQSRRRDMPLCLALLDIDHFKTINDTYNHSIGDKVLIWVAQEISRYCREEDLVVRWGGEEFAVLLPNCNSDDAMVICERIRLAITQIDCSSLATDMALSISIGVTSYHQNDSFEQLISRADDALYTAKQAGRNRVRLV